MCWVNLMVWNRFLRSALSLPVVLPITLLTVGTTALSVHAQTQSPTPARNEGTNPSARTASTPMYRPMRIERNEITDTLTDKDIPTGFGGFFRDYVVTLEEGDNVVIDLTSDEFDTIISLLAPDGSTLSENDDGPDGTTNSMLFARISRGGDYVLRVRPYGGQGTGTFNLKVTRLRPID